jgi:hypothetical protein
MVLEQEPGSTQDAMERAAPVVKPSSSAANGGNPRVREEIEQLKQIEALVGPNPAQALRLVSEANLKFRGGVFGPEREALSIIALHNAGQEKEAKARATVFLERNAQGPLSDRVRRAIE